MFQRSGYLISMGSVILLGMVAWDGSETDTMRLVTIIGVLTSIIGMAFRWISFEREEKSKPTTAPGPVSRARLGVPAPSRPHHEPGRSAHLT